MPMRVPREALESIARNLPGAGFYVGATGGIQPLNDRAEDLLRDFTVARRPKQGEKLSDLFGDELALRILRTISNGAKRTLSWTHAPVPGVAKARSTLIELYPIADPKGPERGAVLKLRDIDSQAPLNEDQRARLFDRIYRFSHNAIEITDPSGVLVDVNPAFEQIYGYDRADLIGKKPRIVRSPRTPSEIYPTLWKQLLDPKEGHWSGELVNVDRYGREHEIRLDIAAVRNADGELTHFLGIASDVSQERLLELQAVRAERLASLGQLAAGVAHEINTPLANVLLIAESVKAKAPNAWTTERSEAIISQVETAARIVQGLLDFSRSQPAKMTRINLVEILDEAVRFLRGKQSTQVEIREQHDRPDLPVKGDRIRLLQVFVNLLNNAYDALEGKGQIRLTSRIDGDTAEIRLSDNGPGIPAAVYPHLFEPFFTTKPAGKGTGLGLSICYGIVKAHGGEISAEHGVGAGATFVVRIPLDATGE